MLTTLEVRVTRASTPPDEGGRTLFFKLWYGRLGKFFNPGEVPEFDGDEAWFEVTLDHRGVFRFVRQVGSPTALPPEPLR